VVTIVRTIVDGSTVWPGIVVEGVTTDVTTSVLGVGVGAVVTTVVGGAVDAGGALDAALLDAGA
jgi:hypothetical protein